MTVQPTTDVFDADAEDAALTARLAHIPLPDGATADGWFSIRASHGDAIRALEWRAFELNILDGAGVLVGGWQDEDEVVTTHVALLTDETSTEMTADQARELAATLVQAADALERLQ